MNKEHNPIDELSYLINRRDKEHVFTTTSIILGVIALCNSDIPVSLRVCMYASSVVGTWINGQNSINSGKNITNLENQIFKSYMGDAYWQK